MKIYEFDNYRMYLKSELADRQSNNPSYSLRAMARQLNVAGSTLSEIINGHANLSVTTARKIAGGLNLANEEKNYFCDLVQLNSESNLEAKEQLSVKMDKLYPKYQKSLDLSLELFKQLSDWYHLTIMEMPFLNKFDLSSVNISKFLDIPVPLVELAIDRLVILGIFERTKSGALVRRQHDLKVRSEIQSAAMKKYYKQALEKVSAAIDTQTPGERLSGYLNLAIDEKAFPEIDQAIDRFFSEVKLISAKYKNKKNVYHLSLHFINMMKRNKI